MGVITLRQAAQWCGGYVDPKFENITFLGANMDTRKLLPGQLFVALEGARDGHDFIDTAFEKGAAAALCKRCRADQPAIVVEDPRVALGKIAMGHRKQIGMKTVGVTGSVGKSTTKEMIACVLDGDFAVSKTPANFNNDLGMPMAILSMPETTQVAVLEMGMSHFGEIAYLSHIAQPDLAVIINVGTMHMENLGSRQGILQAKLEILEGMGSGSRLFLNADNDMLQSWTPDREVTWFGQDCADGICAVEIREDAGSITYTVQWAGEPFAIWLPLEGLHYVSDSLAAVSVGLHMGVTPAMIAARLAAFRTMEGRQEIFEAKGVTIIKDCYNAGPESMAAALSVLSKRSGKRIAVLGDMLELGDCAQEAHRHVGALAAVQADVVLAYGPLAQFVAQGAGDLCEIFTDRTAMAQRLRQIAAPGDTLLFKGSHGMHMELVLDAFLKLDI